MEKLGVEKSELLKELQIQYKNLKEKHVATKEASAGHQGCSLVEKQMEEIKRKINDLDAQD